jgi:hypothetical protein
MAASGRDSRPWGALEAAFACGLLVEPDHGGKAGRVKVPSRCQVLGELQAVPHQDATALLIEQVAFSSSGGWVAMGLCSIKRELE